MDKQNLNSIGENLMMEYVRKVDADMNEDEIKELWSELLEEKNLSFLEILLNYIMSLITDDIEKKMMVEFFKK